MDCNCTAQLRPSAAAVSVAVSRLVDSILQLPEIRIRKFKALLPCSHATRTLCLLRGLDAFETWDRFLKEGRMRRSVRMGFEYVSTVEHNPIKLVR